VVAIGRFETVPRDKTHYGGGRRDCWEADIGHRAHVYLQRPGTKIAVDLGEKDLDVRPIHYGRAQFEHDGRTEVGQIEQIDPGDWETTGSEGAGCLPATGIALVSASTVCRSTASFVTGGVSAEWGCG